MCEFLLLDQRFWVRFGCFRKITECGILVVIKFIIKLVLTSLNSDFILRGYARVKEIINKKRKSMRHRPLCYEQNESLVSVYYND